MKDVIGGITIIILILSAKAFFYNLVAGASPGRHTSPDYYATGKTNVGVGIRRITRPRCICRIWPKKDPTDDSANYDDWDDLSCRINVIRRPVPDVSVQICIAGRKADRVGHVIEIGREPIDNLPIARPALLRRRCHHELTSI
jgi:hypothetical protein